MNDVCQQAPATKDLRNRSPSGIPERIHPEDLTHARDHLARYLFAAHWAPGVAVVDLCCGMGYGAGILAAAGASRVLGVDVNPEVVCAAEGRFSSPVVQFTTGDVSAPLDLPAAELVTCIEGIEHVDQPEVLLTNVVRCLAKDGCAIISTPNAGERVGGHSGNQYHLREYYLDDFRALLGGFFRTADIYFQWGSADPLDFRWSLRQALRSVVPVPVKHWFRSRFSRKAGSTPNASFGVSSMAAPYDTRPYPLNYLKLLPGLRHAQPSIWMAVCREPIGR